MRCVLEGANRWPLASWSSMDTVIQRGAGKATTLGSGLRGNDGECCAAVCLLERANRGPLASWSSMDTVIQRGDGKATTLGSRLRGNDGEFCDAVCVLEGANRWPLASWSSMDTVIQRGEGKATRLGSRLRGNDGQFRVSCMGAREPLPSPSSSPRRRGPSVVSYTTQTPRRHPPPGLARNRRGIPRAPTGVARITPPNR
jgi:hypothetical protein